MHIFMNKSSRGVRMGAMALATMALLGTSQGAFVIYDSFDVDGPVNTALWDVRGPGTIPMISGGKVTMELGEQMRSTAGFAAGTTFRYTVESWTPQYLMGANSQTTWWDGTAVDAMYIRSDGGSDFYADGVPIGTPNTGSTAPAIFDFVYGVTNLEIYRDSVLLASIVRPVNFNDDLRFDFGVYDDGALIGTMVVSEVSYEVVPEPGTVGLLGLAGVGLLMGLHKRWMRQPQS